MEDIKIKGDGDYPPIDEIFTIRQLIDRHAHLLNYARMAHALRDRDNNGLAAYVYETKSGQLMIHEPGFLRWFLGIDGSPWPKNKMRKKNASR